jgi:ABC-type multidrug transport system ATPase subunit
MSTIAVEALTKRYGTVTAVSDLSFELAPGRITGFPGPNGAGKSTSHLLAELAQTVDDVVLINHGRLVAAGPMAGLLGRAGATSLEGFFLDATSGDAPPAHLAPTRARSLS